MIRTLAGLCFLIAGMVSSPHHGQKILLIFFKGAENFQYKLRLAEDIEKRVQLPVTVSKEIAQLPAGAFDKKKKKWSAEVLLNELRHYKQSRTMVIGVVNVDIYGNGADTMFGAADVRNGIALVALPRLRDEFYRAGNTPPHLFYRRVLTECVHELGHLLSLPHCDNVHCVMHFSSSLTDTDIKGPDFCRRCLKKLQELRIY